MLLFAYVVGETNSGIMLSASDCYHIWGQICQMMVQPFCFDVLYHSDCINLGFSQSYLHFSLFKQNMSFSKKSTAKIQSLLTTPVTMNCMHQWRKGRSKDRDLDRPSRDRRRRDLQYPFPFNQLNVKCVCNKAPLQN